MYVRWLKLDFFEQIKDSLGLDNHIISKSIEHSPHLCFYVVDDKDNFFGFICGYEFENNVSITAFFAKSDDVKLKLLKSLIQCVHNKSLQTIIHISDFELFCNVGFEKYADVLGYVSSGRAVAFNFTTNHAKEVNNPNFFQIAYKLNKKIVGDDLYDYTSRDMNSGSSLNLATNYGYLHSRALNKDIIISPFFVEDMNYMDAEKLLRGVLHYRGLKKLKAYIPDIAEIKELFESYKFEQKEKLVYVYLGEKPKIKLDNVYSF
jgi:hypothetical protein